MRRVHKEDPRSVIYDKIVGSMGLKDVEAKTF